MLTTNANLGIYRRADINGGICYRLDGRLITLLGVSIIFHAGMQM